MNCVVAQEPYAPWFTGSVLCHGINNIKRVAETAPFSVRRWLLVGQSSGGYGALYLSRLMPHSVALAFAPQTSGDAQLKAGELHSPPTFALSSTNLVKHPIRDLRGLYFSQPAVDCLSYIIAAYSEHGNPAASWLWLDATHWGRLVDHADVTVFLTEDQTHTVLDRHSWKVGRLLGNLASLSNCTHHALTAAISAALYDRIN